jgi:hypothetical protein
VWLSEETVDFAFNMLVFITEAESVYCAVRDLSLYKTDTFRLSVVEANRSAAHRDGSTAVTATHKQTNNRAVQNDRDFSSFSLTFMA